MNQYRSVAHRGESVYENRKSVFYGRVMPVGSEEEALAFLDSCKKEYPDAKHHVYAYVLRDRSIVRFSDDREPQGTAGVPILDFLKKQGLCDVVCVVTRYFGGTLLGTGGLVKAYTEAAAMAVTAAEPVVYDTYAEYRLTFSYSDYQKVDTIFSANNFLPDGINYGSSVIVVGSVRKTEAEEFIKSLVNLTAGRVKTELLSEKFDFRK